ncbi:MAG TPA: hypothetical protein VM260_12970 [Pirellula sp.]|nr:hypothetical protein [Pirellula sp.]
MSALIANPAIRSLLRGVLIWANLWIGTTILFGFLGFVYVMIIKHDTFLASQALLVRDEATGAVMRLGRFQSQAEMKAAQETILEMAKSQQVVRDALIAVGPPKSFSSGLDGGEYPSKEQVEEVAKSSISVHAPKGTEFGVTEVIYMDVKSYAKDAAVSLSKALTDALESRLQQVRKARADGVLAELTHARDAAKRELANSTSQLNEIERQAGADLTDLRGMTDSIAGAATLRAEFDQTKNDLRQAEITRQSLIADRELLVRATEDPTSFIITPGVILNSQPGLKRLREGLVDAQLNGSQLTGKFTSNHPSVLASQSAQSSIIKRFMQELRASISGVESDIALVDGRIQRLETQKESAQDRLTKLADSRATYANLLSEVKSKVAILESSERELAQVQAARDSSVSTSLLTRLDTPIVSDRPIGPGKTTIAALCTIAGLVFGLGIVFAITPLDASPVFGRRAFDRERGRRDEDLLPRPESTQDKNTSAPINPTTVSKAPLNDPAKPKSALSVDEPKTLRPLNKLSVQLDKILSDNEEKSRNALVFTNQKLTEAYQPRKTSHVGLSNDKSIETADAKKCVPIVTSDIDKAFEELAILKSRKPVNRSEELALQIKVQELAAFLSSQGVQIDVETKESNDDTPRTKPRPVRPK